MGSLGHRSLAVAKGSSVTCWSDKPCPPYRATLAVPFGTVTSSVCMQGTVPPAFLGHSWDALSPWDENPFPERDPERFHFSGRRWGLWVCHRVPSLSPQAAEDLGVGDAVSGRVCSHDQRAVLHVLPARRFHRHGVRMRERGVEDDVAAPSSCSSGAA